METRNRFFFILILLVIGVGGIAAQTVLLRELLIVFAGNELSMGLIIGAWVVWEASGAYLGGKTDMALKRGAAMLATLALLLAIVFPASIYVTRTFRVLAGISTEVTMNPWEMLSVSFLVLLPVGFIHGFLFTLACTLWNRATKEAASAGKVYYYEMVGTIGGGILVNLVFLPYCSSFEIALGLVVLTGLAGLLFILFAFPFRPRLALAVLACVTLASVVFIIGGGTDRLDQKTVEAQWQGRNVVFYGNSYYQNIVVTRTEDQYTLFSDGLPFMTTPVPDIAFTEEFVHFALLAHPLPRKVLVLGGGAGGPISEVLKYSSVITIDYVEIDPMFLDVLRRFPTPLTQRELGDSRVHLHFMDGRTFLKESKEKYDVLLVNLPPPRSLQQNRFFTEEFFLLARKRLAGDGIMSLPMTGSLTYYSPELRAFNLSILTTLRTVFPCTYTVPGDINFFMASPSEALTAISPALLSGRLEERNIATLLFSRTHLDYRMSPEKRKWLLHLLQGKDGDINRDFSPRGLFHNMAFQNLLNSPFTARLLVSSERMKPWHGFVLVLILLTLFFLLSRRYPRLPLVCVIGSTGFAAMCAELVLLFAFQIFHGYVFYEVGILLTIFMGGMAAGSLATFMGPASRKPPFRILTAAETGFVVLALLLALFLYYPSLLSFWRGTPSTAVILFLLFISGLFTGAEFPLAVSRYEALTFTSEPSGARSPGRSAGLLYSVDLLGGWIGGLAAGFLLLPVLGLPESCLLLAALKAGSLLLLLTSRQK